MTCKAFGPLDPFPFFLAEHGPVCKDDTDTHIENREVYQVSLAEHAPCARMTDIGVYQVSPRESLCQALEEP